MPPARTTRSQALALSRATGAPPSPCPSSDAESSIGLFTPPSPPHVPHCPPALSLTGQRKTQKHYPPSLSISHNASTNTKSVVFSDTTHRSAHNLNLLSPPSPIEFDTDIWNSAPAPIALPSLWVFPPTDSSGLSDASSIEIDSPVSPYTTTSESSAYPSPSSTATSPAPSCSPSPRPGEERETLGTVYNPKFPDDHHLNAAFIDAYILGDELGAGGYGFVMTARARARARSHPSSPLSSSPPIPHHPLAQHLSHYPSAKEVAVKFIIKSKVPAHAWAEDELFGRVPTEVLLVSLLDHENIVRCVDVFEDDVYFYLVQELHGSPWVKGGFAPPTVEDQTQTPVGGYLGLPVGGGSATPALSPSSSASSLASTSAPPTPCIALPSLPSAFSMSSSLSADPHNIRPNVVRRPSHDLFEHIEQSTHKRLPEAHARHIFAQVLSAVSYLSQHGVTHRDIKDENLVIDANLTVKLIDFGSAVISDPNAEQQRYTLFYGTTAYAAPEILRREPYFAGPAEVWTLGVLLGFLLTGASPFPTERDALEGRIRLKPPPSAMGRQGGMYGLGLSRGALEVMARCLVVDPAERATIAELVGHEWLEGALGKPPLSL